jgi:hypothetical protein
MKRREFITLVGIIESPRAYVGPVPDTQKSVIIASLKGANH